MNEKYNIVYTTDDNFCSVMGVSILSLFENNKKAPEIKLTIIESNVSLQHKEQINMICSNYGRSLPEWCKSIDITKKLNMEVSVDRGSLSQYSRLFLNNFVDESIDRVLYLDCDTVIVGDLSDLWNLDLKNNVVGALKDAFSIYYRKNIDLEDNAIMFNSGVMLIDMNKWRNFNIEQQLFEFIDKKRGKVQQGDQGVLNAVLSDVTLPILPEYNAVSIFFEYSYNELLRYRQPVNFYSKKEIESSLEKVKIMHFTSAFDTIRPWFKNSNMRNRDVWFKYFKKSPWKDQPLKKEMTLLKSIILFIRASLPRRMFIDLFRLFQIYGRPFKNKIF